MYSFLCRERDRLSCQEQRYRNSIFVRNLANEPLSDRIGQNLPQNHP